MKNKNSESEAIAQHSVLAVPDDVWTKWLQIITRHGITQKMICAAVGSSHPIVRAAINSQQARKPLQLAITNYLSQVAGATDPELEGQLKTLNA